MDPIIIKALFYIKTVSSWRVIIILHGLSRMWCGSISGRNRLIFSKDGRHKLFSDLPFNLLSSRCGNITYVFLVFCPTTCLFDEFKHSIITRLIFIYIKYNNCSICLVSKSIAEDAPNLNFILYSAQSKCVDPLKKWHG